MELHWFDIALFVSFFAVAIGTSLYKSRRDESGEDFSWPAEVSVGR